MMNAQNKIDQLVNKIPVQNKKQKTDKKLKLSLARSSTNSSFNSDTSQPSYSENFQPLNSFSVEEISLYNVDYFLKEQAGKTYAESNVKDFFIFFEKIEEVFGFQKFVLEQFLSPQNLSYQNLIEFFDLIIFQSEQINQFKSKQKPQRLAIETLSILINIDYQHDLIFDLLTQKVLCIMDQTFYQNQEWQKFARKFCKFFVNESDLYFNLLTQLDVPEILKHSLLDSMVKKYYQVYQQNFFNYQQDHDIQKNQLFELFCFFQFYEQAFELIKENEEFQNIEFLQVLLDQMIEKQLLNQQILEAIDQMIAQLDTQNEDIFLQLIQAYLILDKEQRALQIRDSMFENENFVQKQQTCQYFVNYYFNKNDYENIENIIKKFKDENWPLNFAWIQSYFQALIVTQDIDKIIEKIKFYKDEYLINSNVISNICSMFKNNNVCKEKFEEFYLLSKDIFTEHHLQNPTVLNFYLSISLHHECIEIFDEVLEMSKEFKTNVIRSNLIIKRLLNEERHEECYNFIKDLNLDSDWLNCSIGRLLNYCTKFGDVEKMETIYSKMVQFNAQLCSIDYTNFIYTYQKANRPEDGLKFFEQIKHNKDFTGMRITYNCALNLYASLNRIDDTICLFEEIDSNFQADHISYNTIIKALSNNKKIQLAYKYICKLIDNLDQVEDLGENFFNYFLESCSDKKFYPIGIKTYKKILENNLKVNIITMGTMVKLYGFAQKLNKAFDLLDFMKQQDIQPNLIYFTNLVHVSFYNKNFKSAENAFELCCQHNVDRDSIFYSKLIDGMIFMKKKKNVMFFMKKANEEKCGLKSHTIEKLQKYCKDDNSLKLLQQITKNSMTQCHKEKGFERNNGPRVKKYKNMALQKKAYNDNRKMNNQQPTRKGFNQAKIEGLMDNQTKNLVAQFRKRKVHQYQLNCFIY